MPSGKRLNPLIQVGLVLLVLASLSPWLLRHTSAAGHDFTDALTGFLYGLAIGCLLLGIRKNRERTDEAPAE